MRTVTRLPLLLVSFICWMSWSTGVIAEEVTFERDIRPLLKTHCFHCHGEGDELAGGLDLRLRRFIVRGGESGAAVLPGKAEQSLLWQRINAGEMPPEEVESRLSKDEIKLIAKWVAGGAKTAREEPTEIGPAGYITDEERNYWAFRPIQRPEPPRVRHAEQVRTPIDQFVLARLEPLGLALNGQAGPETLLRRVCFDLTGLPPTAELTQWFLQSDQPDRYEQLIDRMLSSPRYGERWGRHWLDVAGYADSEGYTDADAARPDAWKYRDYVISSLNRDKPLDQFIREQLAGDEMVAKPYADQSTGDLEKLVATGFLRMAPDGTGGSAGDQQLARNEVIAKTIEIASTSLLGLTVGCAQCHDHRYDPISQQDYYQFRAIFDPAYDWKQWRTPKQRRISLYRDVDRKQAQEIEKKAKQIEQQRTAKQTQYIEATFQRELVKLPEPLREPIRQARETPEKKRTAAQKKLLKEHPSVNVTAGSLYLYDRKAADDLKSMAEKAKAIRQTKPVESFVRALSETPNGALPKSFLFYRGDHQQPRQQVNASELTILNSEQNVAIPQNDPALPTSGRRLAYARWLTSGRHPLLARVLVNRVWLHHFGQGIVSTPGDFGYLGTRPTHPQLLDWLASQMMDQDWSLKQLHRLIMTSAVYRQSSLRRKEHDQVDSENRLYARMPIRRLEAEVLRDGILEISGQLNLKSGGPPVPVMADRVGRFVIGIENLNAGRPGKVIEMGAEPYRRSIWIQVRRSRPLSVLEPFDLPRMEPNCTVRNESTVAPQSLLLMNSQFVLTYAERFAKRVQSEVGDRPADQVARAWLLAFQRHPSDEQSKDAIAFLSEQTNYFAERSDGKKDSKPAMEALASFCQALLSSNEFLYID